MANNIAILYKRKSDKDGDYYLEPIDFIEGEETILANAKCAFVIDKNYISSKLNGDLSEEYAELSNGSNVIPFMSNTNDSEYVYGSPTTVSNIIGLAKKLSKEKGNKGDLETNLRNISLAVSEFKTDYLEALREYYIFQSSNLREMLDVNSGDELITVMKRKDTSPIILDPEDMSELILTEELELDLTNSEQASSNKQLPKSIDVKKMSKECKKYIIGQDEHIGPILCAINDNLSAKTPQEKTNILVCGDTGVGKSAILSFISKQTGLPIVIEDATQFSITGYAGRDVSDIFEDLLAKADNDLELAQKGIIMIDEIDKKASGSNDRVSGVGVLQSMFKFLEGGEYTYEVKDEFRKVIKKFNTLNTTFVFSGAFSGIDSFEKKSVGFSRNETPRVHDIFSVENMKMYGVPPEFTGRLHLIEKFNPLSEATLKKILLNAKESALEILSKRLKRYNTTLKYDEAFIDAVAREAYKRKTNARALTSVLKDATKMAEYEIQCDPDVKKELILTPECVYDSKAYKLRRVRKITNKK